jgi:hypothetical protein
MAFLLIQSGLQGAPMMRYAIIILSLSLILPTTVLSAGNESTRGVGIYPGDPKEDFAPILVPDNSTYHNLALLKPAYHSSSYDYNLTAQLAVDGIKEKQLPRWLVTTLSKTGVMKKNEREFPVDHNTTSSVNLGGTSGWIQFELAGSDVPLEIDRIDLETRIQPPARPRSQEQYDPPADQLKSVVGQWICIVTGSADGTKWEELGRAGGDIPPSPPSPFPFFGPSGPTLNPSVSLSQPSRNRFYRISMNSTGEGSWIVSEVAFLNKKQRVEAGGPYNFSSSWMAEGKGEEWLYVDLGAGCTFDRIVLTWIRRAAEGFLQVSDDAANWKNVQALPQGTGLVDDLKFSSPVKGRYVRVFMNRPATQDGYILSELEVYGRGGFRSNPKPAPEVRESRRLDLAAGRWRLQRDSLVKSDGAVLSKAGFNDSEWIVATVPATVLSSYWNVGALPDPNYGENQLMISDSFFYADFWYRNEFVIPEVLLNRKLRLNFDGINWKAEVFLNGVRLGTIEGAFTRSRFDITSIVRARAKNALAVRILKNATPGSMKQKTLETAGLNGGALGADNPTYHASIGWDWIPTVRGRNTGIWNDVYLTASGPVTIENPFIKTALPLPDTSRADVRVEVSLSNHEAKPVSGTLKGRFGDVVFEQPVTVDAASNKTVVLDPSTYPELRINNPKLWWPAGYGEQNLYNVELLFVTDGKVSDIRSFKTGVRQFTYSEEKGTLRIWINGRRFIGRGGNWGFPETNLRYRGREYDIAVRYHKDMNFTMIRNWVGQTGDEEFYEACDKYGIVIWQDFWLANPVDGPNPDDDDLFLRNAKDFVLNIRNHPSVGLYCGRNEGEPPKQIDDGIRKMLPELHPGLHYISNSAWGVVSGGGPYAAQTPKYYFQYRATPKLHSELGMPNIVTYDSLRQMMPESALWPQGLSWGLHDFNLTSAQRLSGFQAMIDKSYGGADNAADWVQLAQFINYNGYRAIFEAQSKNRMGLLLWMSHPCWPSFVWQTYDYYFEPTAGYFGSKKGSEPLHIQWNPLTEEIELVNYSKVIAWPIAVAEILNMDGSIKWQKTVRAISSEDSVQSLFKIEYPEGLTPVHFIRLMLFQDGPGFGKISENVYWRGIEENNFQALRTLPKVKLKGETHIRKTDSRYLLTADLHNISAQPALMVHLKIVRAKSGDRILPALFSDNYITLMPGESRSIQIEIDQADTRGQKPRILVDGFNIGKVNINEH